MCPPKRREWTTSRSIVSPFPFPSRRDFRRQLLFQRKVAWSHSGKPRWQARLGSCVSVEANMNWDGCARTILCPHNVQHKGNRFSHQLGRKSSPEGLEPGRAGFSLLWTSARRGRPESNGTVLYQDLFSPRDRCLACLCACATPSSLEPPDSGPPAPSSPRESGEHLIAPVSHLLSFGWGPRGWPNRKPARWPRDANGTLSSSQRCCR